MRFAFFSSPFKEFSGEVISKFQLFVKKIHKEMSKDWHKVDLVRFDFKNSDQTGIKKTMLIGDQAK